jgi:hypothetical protein
VRSKYIRFRATSVYKYFDLIWQFILCKNIKRNSAAKSRSQYQARIHPLHKASGLFNARNLHIFFVDLFSQLWIDRSAEPVEHAQKEGAYLLGALFNILLPLVYLSAALKTPNMLSGAFSTHHAKWLKNNQYHKKRQPHWTKRSNTRSWKFYFYKHLQLLSLVNFGKINWIYF